MRVSPLACRAEKENKNGNKFILTQFFSEYDTSEKEQFVSCIESMGSGKLKKGLQQAQQSAECDDSTCLVSKLCENEVAAQKLLSNIGQENIMEFVDIAEQCFQ